MCRGSLSVNAPSCNWSPVERHRTIYKRLETDEEFRERLQTTSYTVVMVLPDPQRQGEDYAQYRMRTKWMGETDFQWITRVTTKAPVRIATLHGHHLDDAIWEALKIQRRIVEVVP